MNICIIIMLCVILIIMLLPNKKKEYFDQDANLICGVTEDRDQLWCAWNSRRNPFENNLDWTQIKGSVKRVFLTKNKMTKDHYMYVLDENGYLYFRNDYKGDFKNPINWYLINNPGSEIKKFKNVSVNDNIICGVTEEDKIICYDRNIEINPDWIEINLSSLPENIKFSDIAIDKEYIFLLSSDNKTYFKKNMFDEDEELKEITSIKQFTKISSNGKRICGIDKYDSGAYCYDFSKSEAGLVNGPNWTVIKDKDSNNIKFKNFTVKEDYLIGITIDGGIYYIKDGDNKYLKTASKAIKLDQIDINLK